MSLCERKPENRNSRYSGVIIMGLASALSTALTGLSAAETTIDVVGNNLANSNTIAFKASQGSFATQFLQTRSLGSAPTDNTGGTNPRQVGLGTMVADITPDFNQGTIEISSSPTDLAIQGDGFFVVEGTTGEELYTRNGNLKINSQNELITTTGNRLLGYGVDDTYTVQTTSLEPITIPLGSAAVAKATENVVLEGTLTPTGNLATTAEIIQTGILGDATWTAPDADAAGTVADQSAVPAGTTTWAASNDDGSLTSSGTYRYIVVFANGTLGTDYDTESTPSQTIGPIVMGAADDTIDLSNIPTDSTGSYSTRRIYRTNSTGAGDYYFVAEINDNVTDDYHDTTADAALGAALDDTTLSGNYSYYVTFADAPGGAGTGNESRLTKLLGPVNVVNGRIQIEDLPVDVSGQWSYTRIYRNLASDENTFYYVAEIADVSGGNYTDCATDASIEVNPAVDPDGPRITASTLLTNVLRRDGSDYLQVFDVGTLEFTGRKGGRALDTKEFTITGTTTVLELVNFIEAALGIQEQPGADPANPIPADASGAAPGGSVSADGELVFVANNGEGNAIEISLSGMQLNTAAGQETVSLPFTSTQTAVGESASTDVIVYDSLGIPLNVHITAVLESRTSMATTYRWFADSPNNDPLTGAGIAVGTGLIRFDGEGNYSSSNNTTVSIERRHVSSVSPLAFNLDFNQLSGLAADKSTLAVTNQDGSGPGVLTSFIVGEDGIIRGVFSNGITRDLGQIVLARFSNAAGLEQRGQNLYASGVNSGLPVVGNPGEQGIGQIIAGAVELSNTDVGANLIDLILASTMYRGNTRVITTSQQMLDELLAIRR